MERDPYKPQYEVEVLSSAGDLAKRLDEAGASRSEVVAITQDGGKYTLVLRYS